MFIVRDQFGYIIAVCNNFNNAAEAAKRFTNKKIYVGRSASVFDHGIEIFKTTITSIED